MEIFQSHVNVYQKVLWIWCFGDGLRLFDPLEWDIHGHRILEWEYHGRLLSDIISKAFMGFYNEYQLVLIGIDRDL